MPPEPISRPEFEGYVRRHEADAFAHAPLLDRSDTSGLRFRQETDGRLSALERWQQRIIGGLLFAACLIGGGSIALVVRFFQS